MMMMMMTTTLASGGALRALGAIEDRHCGHDAANAGGGPGQGPRTPTHATPSHGISPQCGI
eukprot:11608360-Karenia_brevis.AAC.1